MALCKMSPKDHRDQIHRVGDDLLKTYGKKRYYSVQEVKAANKRQGIEVDFCCWSHAFFNSHEDFDSYHQTLGEICDYTSMKQEIIESVSTTTNCSGFDFDLSWLDFPDIDFSIFDFFDLS